MGAEALTLVGVLNPDRVPELWERRVGNDDRLRAAFNNSKMPDYKKEALETQLAISAVVVVAPAIGLWLFWRHTVSSWGGRLKETRGN